METNNFVRIKFKECLSWLSAIMSEVSLLVTVEAFISLVLVTALGVFSFIRHRSIARVLPWSRILVLRPFWCVRIIVSHIGM